MLEKKDAEILRLNRQIWSLENENDALQKELQAEKNKETAAHHVAGVQEPIRKVGT